MAHTIQTSPSNSPTAYLKPAPLRILRKSNTVIHNIRDRSDAWTGGNGTKTIATSSQNHTIRRAQSDITRDTVPRRGTGVNIKTLISRFEMLDGLDSADTSANADKRSSYKPSLDKISQPTGSEQMIQQDRSLDCLSPAKSIGRPSPRISPRQTSPPAIPPCGRYEDLLDPTCLSVGDIRRMDSPKEQPRVPSGGMLTSHRSASSTSRCPGQDSGIVADRRRLFEGNKSYCPFNTLNIPISRQSSSIIKPNGHSLPKSKSFPKNNSSDPQSSPASVTSLQVVARSPTKKLSWKRESPRKLSENSTLPSSQSITFPHQRPSVADLKRSFEKSSQPVPHPEGHIKQSAYSESSQITTAQQSQNMPYLKTSKLSPGWLTGRSMMSNSKPASQMPLPGKGQVNRLGLDTKNTQQTSLPRAIRRLTRRRSTQSLQKNLTSPQPVQEEKTKILYRSANWKSLSRLVDDHGSHQRDKSANLNISLDGLTNSLFSESRTDAAFSDASIPQHEKLIKETPSRNLFKFPRAMSPGRRLAQVSGKVSQLRKIFERPSRSFSSSLSILNIRSRTELDESTEALMANCPSLLSLNEFSSLTPKRTIPHKRSAVPSLTTEISVNDFFCEFVGSPNHEENPALTSPGEVTIEVGAQIKQESPVKNRIQQFEHMNRDSSNLRASLADHERVKDDSKTNGKRNVAGGWKPIHQKGTAIWKKISGSINRPLESWKDAKSRGHERINVDGDANLKSDLDCSRSLRKGRGRGIRRSSSFGYSLHRVSHMSPKIESTSYIPSSPQSNSEESLVNAPNTTSNANHGRTSPGTSPSARKRFHIISRMASGLGHPRSLGLDGHFLSKAVQDEELEPLTAKPSSPSPPQGDLKALIKVMSKQSAVERGLPKQDEKHLHLDKKLRALVIWRGKSKVDEVLASADGAITSEENSKKCDKGKGKEKGILARESNTENERQQSGEGENEPNKKTDSGFVIFETKDIKLRHPKPRRPGQARKLANLYRESWNSGASLGTKANSGNMFQESRLSLRRKASSALGLRGLKASMG